MVPANRSNVNRIYLNAFRVKYDQVENKKTVHVTNFNMRYDVFP